MSEKIRSLNLTSAVGSGSGVGGSVIGSTTLIGNPTLISSTLSTNHNLTPTIDLINAAAAQSAHARDCIPATTPTALNASHNTTGHEMDSSSAFAAGSGIAAQLNFQLLANVVDSNNPATGSDNILDYNSIMNSSSQFSAISNDALQTQQTTTTATAQQQPTQVGALSNNSMALVKAGAGKPVVAQSVAGVSC